MTTPIEGQESVVLLNLEQIKVLSSVAAAEVFNALASDQPRSIREAAEEIGRAASSVSEHIAKLLEVGLIMQCGTRKVRSRTEALYVHKGLVTRMSLVGQPLENIEQYLVRFRGLMSLTDRQHEMFWRAIHVDPSFASYGRTLRTTVYLTKDQCAKLRAAAEELYQMAASMHESNPELRDPNDHVRIQVNAMFFPTVEESKRRISAVEELDDVDL